MSSKLKGLFIFFILLCPLLAQYNFDFANTTDTVVVDTAFMEFYFRLENTGTLPDTYAFDCRVVDSVPGWFASYCAGGLCTVPGYMIYEYLGVDEMDTTVHVEVYPTQDSGVAIYNLHVQSIFEPTLKDSITVFAVYGIPGQYSFDFDILTDTIMADTGMVEFQFYIENTGTSPDTYAFDLRVLDSVPGWDESFHVDGVWALPGTILTEYLGVWAIDSALYVRVDPTREGTEVLNLHVSSTANPGLEDSITMYVVFHDPGIEEYIHRVNNKPMLRIHPNPFKNRTDIRLEIPDMSDKMHLEIYDVSGRLVKQFLLPTPYSLVPTAVSWDGKDELGLELPQGVYVVRLECQDVILTDKTILLR
jgi:hypothetical protein